LDSLEGCTKIGVFILKHTGTRLTILYVQHGHTVFRVRSFERQTGYAAQHDGVGAVFSNLVFTNPQLLFVCRTLSITSVGNIVVVFGTVGIRQRERISPRVIPRSELVANAHTQTVIHTARRAHGAKRAIKSFNYSADPLPRVTVRSADYNGIHG